MAHNEHQCEHRYVLDLYVCLHRSKSISHMNYEYPQQMIHTQDN